MKVTILKRDPNVYSAFSYFVQGDWNALSDVNTLIDVGVDSFIINELESLYTGVGKRRVEQVILTHEHFDHAGGLKYIVEKYHPKVIAGKALPLVDIVAYNGMPIKIGDRDAVIYLTPGHSNDSLCVYCESEQVIFSGDTPLVIRSPGGSYLYEYVKVLEHFATLNIKTIYSGHDDPITENASEIIKNTLKNVKNSHIIY